MEDKFITLAIHTVDHAVGLKRILENHGINVKLQNYLASGAPIAVAVRVMIQEKNLPLALKVTESIEHISSVASGSFMNGEKGQLLLPVDFNNYCLNACKAGFELAAHLELHPVLLHANPAPMFTPSFSTDDASTLGINNSLDDEFDEVEISQDLQKAGRKKMKDLLSKIHAEQEAGNIPDLKFKVIMEDGVAEDVIKEYCKVSPPAIVVMVTRCKEKKGEQLIGSVTAEVLDDCRVPLLSIPENSNFSHINNLKEVVFLCNMDQHDLICVDTFMRMFEYPEVNITLIPFNDKQDKNLKSKLFNLKNYFNTTYPTAHFMTEIFPSKTFMADFNNYESQRGSELIIVPNKRKNAFMRLFNPGMAHRLLFERDLPLLALPI